MKICFPVVEDRGLESRVYDHFGSAPGFIVIDTLTSEVTSVPNLDHEHQHGACNPVAGLGGREIDAVVVGGIGGGALQKLNGAGMRVFQAQKGTIAENMEILKRKGLPEYQPGHACAGHGHGQGCSH